MTQRLINIYENYFKTKYDKNDINIKINIDYSFYYHDSFYYKNKNIINIFRNNNRLEIYNKNNNKSYKIISQNILYYTNIKNNDIIIYSKNLKSIYSLLVDDLKIEKVYKNNILILKLMPNSRGAYKFKYFYNIIYKQIYIYKYINKNIKNFYNFIFILKYDLFINTSIYNILV